MCLTWFSVAFNVTALHHLLFNTRPTALDHVVIHRAVRGRLAWFVRSIYLWQKISVIVVVFVVETSKNCSIDVRRNYLILCGVKLRC